MIRVLQISTSDWKGGAARVAHYLTAGLRARGIEADLYARDRTSAAPFVHPLPIRPAQPSTLRQRVLGRLGLDHLYTGQRAMGPAVAPDFGAVANSYDVVHLHDVPAFVPSWCALRLRVPLVWTIHSMAPLTGGCLYAYGCNRWRNACGTCPQLGIWPMIYNSEDHTAEELARKDALYGRMSFHAVGVSQWIADRIGESVMGRQPCSVVQNPSWTPDFYPVDRARARARLGVPEGAFAVLFSVSGKLEDRRKGFDIVLEAVTQIRANWPDANRLFLLPTGIVSPSDEMHRMLAGFPGLTPRHLETAADLRDYYAAADVVWHPSRADTSSMVSLEAFGCGTPVIAAAVGGVPEIVEDGVSGLLIPPDDPWALMDATRRLIDRPDLGARLRAGALARAAALGPDRFLDGYLDVYRRAIASHEGPREGPGRGVAQ